MQTLLALLTLLLKAVQTAWPTIQTFLAGAAVVEYKDAKQDAKQAKKDAQTVIDAYAGDISDKLHGVDLDNAIRERGLFRMEGEPTKSKSAGYGGDEARRVKRGSENG